MLFYLLYTANKCFTFKSCCVLQVMKHLKLSNVLKYKAKNLIAYALPCSPYDEFFLMRFSLNAINALRFVFTMF